MVVLGTRWRSLVGIYEALQDAGLQLLHGLAPILRAVSVGPRVVVLVRIVCGHWRLRLQPGAVLPGIHWHQYVVHSLWHSLLALQWHAPLIAAQPDDVPRHG